MEDTTGPTSNEEKIQIKHIPVQEEFSVRKNLELSYISINFLKEIAKWSKFISIVGFVLVGLIVLAGLVMGSIMGTASAIFSEDIPAASFLTGGFVSILYLAMAALYFFPVYYLYNFSSKLKEAIQLHSEVILEESLKNLKSHYKFMGIIIVIMLVIYGGMFLLMSLGAVFASMF